MKLTAGHYMALGMFLTSVATQLAGLQHGWHDALTTTFVAGFLLNLGSIITAAASGKLFPQPAPQVEKV